MAHRIAVVVGHSDVVKRNGPQPERKCGPVELIRNKWPAESLTLRAIRADPEQMAHRIADTVGHSDAVKRNGPQLERNCGPFIYAERNNYII